MNNWLEHIKNLHPQSVTEFIRQILYVGMAFEMLTFKGQPWSEAQIAIVLSAISGSLALFARSSTVSNARIEQKVDEKVAHREMSNKVGTNF